MRLSQVVRHFIMGIFPMVFVCVLLGLLVSCDSPSLNDSRKQPPDQEIRVGKREFFGSPSAKKIRSTPSTGPIASPTQSAEYSTLMFYNLRNYLDMWRFREGKRQVLGKPKEEVTQLVAVIMATMPDILGVCEIGTLEDLYDLQNRLKRAGLELPHFYITEGSDKVRRLAVLSRYPLTANPKPEIEFIMNGEKHQICRGIADVFVHTSIGKIRLLGVHFKSKREVQEYSQEMMRHNEAYALRKHLIKIHSNPATASDKVLIFGDFNDTTKSLTLKTVVGTSHNPGYCMAIPLFDQYGLNWTHHWKYQDIYSRIDFILANKAMVPHIAKNDSYIFDTSKYSKASDHRPLVVKFK